MKECCYCGEEHECLPIERNWGGSYMYKQVTKITPQTLYICEVCVEQISIEETFKTNMH